MTGLANIFLPPGPSRHRRRHSCIIAAHIARANSRPTTVRVCNICLNAQPAFITFYGRNKQTEGNVYLNDPRQEDPSGIPASSRRIRMSKSCSPLLREWALQRSMAHVRVCASLNDFQRNIQRHERVRMKHSGGSIQRR